MTATKLREMTVTQLVEQFTVLALEQDKAELYSDNAKFNQLYWRIDAIRNELKARDGDQRRALASLFDHPNAQVRLNAANATLAVVPEAARQVLRDIKRWREFPQALDAGMTLWALEEGTFKPS